jgi:hypothetical protein
MRRTITSIAVVLTLAGAFGVRQAHADTVMTWEYVHSDRALAKARAFLGNIRGDYVPPTRTVGDAFQAAVSGPPNNAKKIPPSSVLLSGCRLHSCDEKGAVIFDRAERVQAVALISFGCGVKCRRLSVFLRHSSQSARLVAQMQDWALAQEDHAIPMEVVWLHRRRAR